MATNTASNVASKIANSITTQVASLRRHYKPYYSAVFVGVLGSLAVGRAAWRDYQGYLSLGPGGPPYNVIGWLVVTLVRPFRINTLDLAPLEKDPDQRTWLPEGWPEAARSGDRPTLGSHPVPQRQLDQHSPPEVQKVRRLAVSVVSFFCLFLSFGVVGAV